MRIYVASLSDYNAGLLHGVWIDLEECTDESAVWDKVNGMLRASKYPNVTVEWEGKQVPSAEEWAIHDYEMEGIKISESESFEDCLKLQEAFDDHGEAFIMAYNNFGDVDQVITACEEDYQGCHKSLKDWAESLAKKSKYTMRDVHALMVDSLFGPMNSHTIEKGISIFIVKCSAIFHNTEYSKSLDTWNPAQTII